LIWFLINLVLNLNSLDDDRSRLQAEFFYFCSWNSNVTMYIFFESYLFGELSDRAKQSDEQYQLCKNAAIKQYQDPCQ